MVKAFALGFVLTLDNQNAINFQLLGGIWILQTFPAVVFSLYTRWFHRYALLAGWAVGIVYGTVKAYQVINPATGKHFGGSLAEIPGLGDMGYIALTAFVLNLLVAVVLSAVLNATKVSNGRDATRDVGLLRGQGRPHGRPRPAAGERPGGAAGEVAGQSWVTSLPWCGSTMWKAAGSTVHVR